MREHPIPQDITGYRFHIIGSMTLKQFGEIFIGVVVAVLLYQTNLTAPIKWGLIAISVGIGAAAAFLPIEERPLDHWLVTFAKAIYRPTKFFWKKANKIPEAFLYETLSSTLTQEPELDMSPAKRQRIKEYLGSMPEKQARSSDFTQDEIFKMKNILSSFETVNVIIDPKAEKPKSAKAKPNLDVRVRSMRNIRDLEKTNVFNTDDESLYDSILEAMPTEKTEKRKVKKVLLATDQVANDIQIPEPETVQFRTEKESLEDQVTSVVAVDSSEKTFIESAAPETIGASATEDVSFNSNLPFPIRPTEPNKVVGMVLSQNNDLLSSSIVEVQTMDGHIERAVKTNALGQFFITTPLKPGEYNIVVEQDNYSFRPLHIKIDNSIIQPVEIRSEN